MKKIMWLISFFSLAGTALILSFMPERVPMHYDMAGNIDRWGSKYENLIFPVIILFMSLFWSLLTAYYEKKAQKTTDEKKRAEAMSNAGILRVVGAAMAAMFTIMQGFILYGSYREAVSGASRQSVDIGKVSCILLGFLFIILGNYMPKSRRNASFGVRTGWSMYNDNTWRKSNRFGAYALSAAGLLSILTAVLMENSFASAMALLGYLLLATLLTVLYSRRVYLEELEDGKGEKEK